MNNAVISYKSTPHSGLALRLQHLATHTRKLSPVGRLPQEERIVSLLFLSS